MPIFRSVTSRAVRFAVTRGVVLGLCAFALQAQTSVTPRKLSTPEQRAARNFESIRKSPPEMLAFLLSMPKGGDLHNHLSGAIYAESYIQWAANDGLCVSQTMVLMQPPCDTASGQVPASAALTSGLLYRQLIDAWSMRSWRLSGQSGHDHFFDAFGKFGAVSASHPGAMLAEVAARSAKAHISYLELMLTPDGGLSSRLGQQVGWDGNLQSTLGKLKAAGIDAAVPAAAAFLDAAERDKDTQLKCGTAQADPGCSVTIRYVSQVAREGALGPVFAQMVTGFNLSSAPSSKVVALNLVQPEDGVNSMRNFTLQMQMLDFLHAKYPAAHISLHAGELAPGLVPPDGLSFHIRDSVKVGHAERIGHGVDVMHEDDAEDLLREMARRHVAAEVCLTSNDMILGVSGDQHPLNVYLKRGVPVVLATDDEGVSRSEISREYLKAAEEHGLGYLQLKAIARNSLKYAFVEESVKAQLQKSLEEDFRKFEGRY
jgi:adenosine deaminase